MILYTTVLYPAQGCYNIIYQNKFLLNYIFYILFYYTVLVIYLLDHRHRTVRVQYHRSFVKLSYGTRHTVQ